MFEKTPVDSSPMEINLNPDQRFKTTATNTNAKPDPLVPVTVTDWAGTALSGITIPTPVLLGTNDMILHFRPSGGTLNTDYQVRFVVTTVAGDACEIDAIIQVRRPSV
jgi:hypothetical protein